jgi:hypothetical protein
MNIIPLHIEPNRREIKSLSGIGWVLFTEMVIASIAIFPIIIDID